MKRHLWVTIVMAVAVSLCALPFKSHAETKYWIGESGSWDNGSKWSPPGQPQPSDVVYLTQSDDHDRTVTYANSLNPGLTSLYIDSTGTGTMMFEQNKDELFLEKK